METKHTEPQPVKAKEEPKKAKESNKKTAGTNDVKTKQKMPGPNNENS